MLCCVCLFVYLFVCLFVWGIAYLIHRHLIQSQACVVTCRWEGRKERWKERWKEGERRGIYRRGEGGREEDEKERWKERWKEGERRMGRRGRGEGKGEGGRSREGLKLRNFDVKPFYRYLQWYSKWPSLQRDSLRLY